MQKLGKYKIIERIGVGGFGEVFKGYDPFIKRHVAIKTCTSQDEEIRNRFFQEAEIAGNLHHRNITTVYDFGVQDDLPYLIQEYLSGEDLHHKIKRRDFLPYPEKLHYLIQVARGQAYAHDKGVIHRDIKPANIRVLEDGTAKIMDFGIAKLAMQDSGLTKTGMTVGTAAYLAPEQIRGESVTCQTDIFAFGATAYELLTYERPFRGEQISAILYQTLNAEPKAIIEYWPSAPKDIVDIIHCCLRKNPNERYVDGERLLNALEKVQGRGRQSRDSSAGTVPPEVTASTTPMATQPGDGLGGATTQAIEAVEQTVATAVSSSPRLDDIDLSSSRADGATTRMASPKPGEDSIAVAASSGRGKTFVALFVLALLAGLIGWWFGARQQTPLDTLESLTVDSAPGMPPPPTEQAEEQIGVVSGGSSADSPSADSPSAEPPSEAAEPASAAEASSDGAPSASSTTVEETTTPPPEPVLVRFEALPWTDQARLVLDGQGYGLPIRRDLPPGSYEALFVIEDGGYSDRQVIRFTVEAGQQRTVRPEMPEPGQIDVRARLGRSQGRVKINGEVIAQSPMQSELLKPGEYRLEIEALDGTGSLVIDPVEVRSGHKAIVAFDLGAGTQSIHFRPLSQEGQ